MGGESLDKAHMTIEMDSNRFRWRDEISTIFLFLRLISYFSSGELG